MNYRVDPNRTNNNAFFASDATDNRFFIAASIRYFAKERILSFIVVAELPDGTRGQVRGSEFFNAMMDHFGNAAIDVIEGQWETDNLEWTTNLTVFNTITGSSSLSPEAAAALTPTGTYAVRRGFPNVRVLLADPPGADGSYTKVLVQFRK
jgi:hypothetical protein